MYSRQAGPDVGRFKSDVMLASCKELTTTSGVSSNYHRISKDDHERCHLITEQYFLVAFYKKVSLAKLPSRYSSYIRKPLIAQATSQRKFTK